MRLFLASKNSDRSCAHVQEAKKAKKKASKSSKKSKEESDASDAEEESDEEADEVRSITRMTETGHASATKSFARSSLGRHPARSGSAFKAPFVVWSMRAQ